LADPSNRVPSFSHFSSKCVPPAAQEWRTDNRRLYSDDEGLDPNTSQLGPLEATALTVCQTARLQRTSARRLTLTLPARAGDEPRELSKPSSFSGRPLDGRSTLDPMKDQLDWMCVISLAGDQLWEGLRFVLPSDEVSPHKVMEARLVHALPDATHCERDSSKSKGAVEDTQWRPQGEPWRAARNSTHPGVGLRPVHRVSHADSTRNLLVQADRLSLPRKSNQHSQQPLLDFVSSLSPRSAALALPGRWHLTLPQSLSLTTGRVTVTTRQGHNVQNKQQWFFQEKTHGTQNTITWRRALSPPGILLAEGPMRPATIQG